jgi:ankyrin repeat protein
MNDVALKLIDTFGKLCKPEQFDKHSNTALIWACQNKMNDVALTLIYTFGELCKPYHFNSYEYTAFILAKKNNMKVLCSGMINTFGKSVDTSSILDECVIC